MMCFFFNDTATTEIYTLSLHDALPILRAREDVEPARRAAEQPAARPRAPQLFAHVGVHRSGVDDPEGAVGARRGGGREVRSEEHTSELQSRQYLVCRLLLEKKNNSYPAPPPTIVLLFRCPSLLRFLRSLLLHCCYSFLPRPYSHLSARRSRSWHCTAPCAFQ